MDTSTRHYSALLFSLSLSRVFVVCFLYLQLAGAVEEMASSIAKVVIGSKMKEMTKGLEGIE